jgi:hypothetical protein
MPGLSRRLSLILMVVGLLQARHAVADGGDCYDFVSPTLDGLLQPGKVQRLVIVVRTTAVDARLAAKSLSLAARRRGVEVTIMRNSEFASPRDLAVEETEANQAQMAALIEVSTGGEPVTATAELRDPAGMKLAVLTGPRSAGVECQGAGAANPPRGSSMSEWEKIERTPPAASGSPLRDSPESQNSDEEPGHTWYGWQLMLVDTGSLLLLFTPAPALALVSYFAAPPAIHAANDQGSRAWLSFVLRLGIPLAGAGLGLLAASGGSCDKQEEPALCGYALVVGGLAIGMFAAAIIDDTALAWKVSEDRQIRFTSGEPGHPPETPTVSVGVGVLPYRHGAGLGLAGQF